MHLQEWEIAPLSTELYYLTKQKPFLHNSLDIPPSKMVRRYYTKPEWHNDKKVLAHKKMKFSLPILVV